MSIINDVRCDLCKHWFYEFHDEADRVEPTANEERTGRCEDCRKCVYQGFKDIVKGIEVPELVP